LRANTPAEFHPYIATRWKKDCRTWLWKSASQRQKRLAEQGVVFSGEQNDQDQRRIMESASNAMKSLHLKDSST